MHVAPPSDNLVQNSTRLSKREWEVAVLIAEGLLRKQIASRLELSDGAIDSLVFRAAEKIGGTGRPCIRITRFVLAQNSTQLAA